MERARSCIPPELANFSCLVVRQQSVSVKIEHLITEHHIEHLSV
jgi:hypothetical protein